MFIFCSNLLDQFGRWDWSLFKSPLATFRTQQGRSGKSVVDLVDARLDSGIMGAELVLAGQNGAGFPLRKDMPVPHPGHALANGVIHVSVLHTNDPLLRGAQYITACERPVAMQTRYRNRPRPMPCKPLVTEQQVGIAYAYLKGQGYIVALSALQDAMQAALCQDTLTAQTESMGRHESIRLDTGRMYFGDCKVHR